MAAPIRKQLESSINSVSTITQHPEDFLIAQKSSAKKLTNTLKTVYDTTKSLESDAVRAIDTVPELVVKNFDDEQIWQQLELQNNVTISNIVTGVAKLLADKKKISFHSKQKREKDRKHNKDKETVKKQKNLADRLKQKSEELLDKDIDEENLDSDSKVSDSDVEDRSDDELTKIKSRVEEEKDDKFFDFTGDSDDDLNFDFGPLCQGGIDDDDDGGGGGSDIDDHDITQKSKKSVRFKEIDNSEKDSIKKKRKEPNETGKEKSTVKDTKGDKTKKGKETGLNKKGSIVDDAFFKLADMEAFLDQEDRREARRQKREDSQQKREKLGDEDESGSDEDEDEQEDIDAFAELDSEDLHYDDFFDPPDIKLVKGDTDKLRKKERKPTTQEENSDSGENDDDDDDDDDDGQDDEEEEDDEINPQDKSMKRKKALDLLADSDSEGEDIADILGGQRRHQKSTYEQRQEKLKKKISGMEDEAVSEKPWQLAGEITASNRPENSLLQENVEFEHTTRLPPEITEETTKTLEELILQRIKDKAFDDVQRKIKPKDNPFEYKKRITLDQEKSKMSLGEIYEQEYLKQQKHEEEEKTDPDHDAIKKMMQSLFIRLDALSNFHYTPKQAAPEVKIVSNQPSISMEEVAPVSVSDNKLLAPEEVKEKQKGELKGASEKTKTDKFRERKKKKVAKRERQKEKDKRQKLIEKLNPGLGNKYSKERAMRQLEKESQTGKRVTVVKEDKKQKTGLTSSKAFFTQLQDEVSAHISSKKAEKRKKDGKAQASSKKFKL